MRPSTLPMWTDAKKPEPASYTPEMKKLWLAFVFCIGLAPSSAFAGGSGWSYFAPYESDTPAALQKLRWDVFRKGDYYKVDPKRKAKSPEHALRLNGEDGTHSIIDIMKAATAPSDACEIGAVCPLSKAKLVELFGTERPTRAKIESTDAGGQLQSLFSGGSGVYVVVYERNAPKSIYFAGHSGD